MTKTRIPRAGAVLAVVAAACALGACSRKSKAPAAPPPVPVVVGTVVRRDVPIDVQSVGTVEAETTIHLQSQVTGQLQAVHFREGANVERGDLLFTLDPRPFRATLDQAKANLARDRVQAQNLESDVKRFAGLVSKGYVTQQQYESARTQAKAARATVAADEAAVEAARLNLEDTEIRSPVRGRAGAVLTRAGSVVKANDTMLVVLNVLQPILVDFHVPETWLPAVRAHAGEHPRVEAIPALAPEAVAAMPQAEAPETSERQPVAGTSSAGALVFIDNAVDPATGTVLLKASFPNREETLWPGEFVNVVLHVATQRDAVVAPAAAVQRSQSGAYVFVVTASDTVEQQPVEIARADAHEAIVSRGLRGGERVVTDGQLRLSPGAKVSVRGRGTAAAATTDTSGKASQSGSGNRNGGGSR